MLARTSSALGLKNSFISELICLEPLPNPEGESSVTSAHSSGLWITFTPISKKPHSCGMKLRNKKNAGLSIALFLLSNLFSDPAIAAESPESGPKTQCFIKIGDPHISRYLLERRGIRAVKVNAESRCNYFQQNVRLKVRIYKKGRFSNYFVREFEIDPSNPKSSGFIVKNWQSYEICKNQKRTIYFGTAISQAEINGRILTTPVARSADSEPLKCGT